MFTLVTGGSGSGKSAYAEDVITSCQSDTRIYIATMFPYDEESKERVKRHRAMRAQKRFDTVECFTGLKHVEIPSDACVLLECMSNLAANEMFMKEGAGENTVAEIMAGIEHLLKTAKKLVVVTNEIFSDGISYDSDTRRYQQYLGEINRKMAEAAAQVTEVVYGIPVTIKKGAGGIE